MKFKKKKRKEKEKKRKKGGKEPFFRNRHFCSNT